MFTSQPYISSKVLFIVSISLFLLFLSCSKPVHKTVHSPVIITAETRKKADIQPSSELYFYILKGNICAANYDIECALSAFLNAYRLDRSSAFIIFQIAQLHTLKGEFDEAINWTKKALELEPDNIESSRFLAQLYIGLEDTDSAVKQFEEILKSNLSDEDDLFTLAFLYAEKDQHALSLELMKNFLDKNPGSARGYYYLGSILSKINEHDMAIQSYERAFIIDASFDSALRNIALIYENQDNINKAVETYNRILEISPFDYSIRDRLAYLYVRQNEFDSAILQYTIIKETNPDSYDEMCMKIGLVHYEKQEWELAEKQFIEALKSDPENDRILYYLGNLYEKTGYHDKALEYLMLLPQTSKFYPQAQIHIAHIHERNGNLEATILGLKEAVKFLKEEMTIYRFLASIYEKDNNFAEAKNILKKALEVNPHDEDTLYYLGMIYFNSSKHDESLEIMESILEINPMNPDALNFIGYSYAEKGIKLDEAEKLIKKALSIKPDDGYITDSLGWVYYQKGDYKKALNILLRALELVPEDPVIAEHAGDAYMKLNKIPEAVKLYKRAIELDPDREDVQKKIDEIKDR